MMAILVKCNKCNKLVNLADEWNEFLDEDNQPIEDFGHLQTCEGYDTHSNYIAVYSIAILTNT